MKAIDRTGERFGRLVAVRQVANHGNSRMYECKCDCGNTVTVSSGHLGSGHTQSCGCLNLELRITAATKHGMSKTRTFRIWQGMITRCYNANTAAYAHYGMNGIAVCDRWRHDFSAFVADMGEAPENSSIDRIDPHGDYKPDNCRWAGKFTQARNRHRKQTNTSSPYKGVSWHKAAGKFCSKLCDHGRYYWIGLSDNPEELARQYDAKVIEVTGSDIGTNHALGLI